MKLYEVSVYGFVSSKIRAEIEREVKESSLRFMSWPMEKRIIIMVDRHTEGVKEAIAANRIKKGIRMRRDREWGNKK